MLYYSNNGWAKAPQCYITRTVHCLSLYSTVNTHRYCKVTDKHMNGERKKRMMFRWAVPVGLSFVLAAVINCKWEDENFASS